MAAPAATHACINLLIENDNCRSCSTLADPPEQVQLLSDAWVAAGAAMTGNGRFRRQEFGLTSAKCNVYN
jgi:hypothetical protein